MGGEQSTDTDPVDSAEAGRVWESLYGGRPLAHGWMWKRGRINPQYKRRFFVLQGRVLYYFYGPLYDDVRNTLGAIGLQDSHLQLVAGGQPFEFEIITRARRYYLMCDNEADFNHWLAHLRHMPIAVPPRKSSGSIGMEANPEMRERVRKATVTAGGELPPSVALTMYRKGYIDEKDLRELVKSGSLGDSGEGVKTSEQTRPIEDYAMLRVLGRGSFGEVYLVRHIKEGRVYAMKVMSKANIVRNEKLRERRIRNALTERKVMEKLDHPFVAKLRAAFQTSRKLFLVMDFFAGGELFTLMANHVTLARLGAAGGFATAQQGGSSVMNAFSEEWTRFYASEILLAVSHLHEHNVVYRDLKPENVCICADGHLKITDFGLARLQQEGGGALTSFCGTMAYQAPEQVRQLMGKQEAYDKTVDWWAFGVLVFEMLAGEHPFLQEEDVKTFRNILYKKLVFPPFFSNAAKLLLNGLLVRGRKDYRERLGSGPDGGSEIMEEEFFVMTDFKALEAKQIQPPWVPPLQNETDVAFFDPQISGEAPPSLATVAGYSDPMKAPPPQRSSAEELISQLNEWTFREHGPLSTVSGDNLLTAKIGGKESDVTKGV